jgi:GNAT superfamily N-acetyltransferase
MNIRTACIETDLSGIARICNVCEPANATTIDQVRSWFLYSPPERIQLRLVAVDENDAVTGYGVIVHDVWMPAHHFYTWLGVDPAFRRQGIGSSLWDASLDFLQGQEATRLASEVLDDDAAGLAFAKRRGFTYDRHLFDSFLDLTVFDETPYLQSIAALEAQGIRFCSLADFPDTPDTRRKFYDLNFSTVVDIPGEDWDFAAYPAFFERSILGAPKFRREGQLLAVDGNTWAGLAAVSLSPETRSAYNATTGMIRLYRGRKIAQALKIMAARYARQHDANQIRTDNDSLNAPILAINQKMGYQPQPGKYKLVRWLGGIEQSTKNEENR